MKEKVNKYISSFDYIVYVLSHATNMHLFWSQLKANEMLPHVFNIWLFKLLLLLLLFWNNLGRSIQILGWTYIMTRGPMQVCYVAL
jgi:hypothetical protein